MSSRGTSSFQAAPPICGVNSSFFQNVTGPYYNITSLYINASAVPSLNGDSTAAIVFFTLAYAFVLYFIIRERRLKVHPLDILSHARANVDLITAIWGWVIWSILANTLMNSQACGQPCVRNSDVGLLMASLFLYDLLFLKGFLAYLTICEAGWPGVSSAARSTISTATKNSSSRVSNVCTADGSFSIPRFIIDRRDSLLLKIYFIVISFLVSACYPTPCRGAVQLSTCMTFRDNINCVQNMSAIASSTTAYLLMFSCLCILVFSVMQLNTNTGCCCYDAIHRCYCGILSMCTGDSSAVVVVCIRVATFLAFIVLGFVGAVIAITRRVNFDWATPERFRQMFDDVNFNISVKPFSGSSLTVLTIIDGWVILFLHLVGYILKWTGKVSENGRENAMFNGDRRRDDVESVRRPSDAIEVQPRRASDTEGSSDDGKGSHFLSGGDGGNASDGGGSGGGSGIGRSANNGMDNFGFSASSYTSNPAYTTGYVGDSTSDHMAYDSNAGYPYATGAGSGYPSASGYPNQSQLLPVSSLALASSYLGQYNFVYPVPNSGGQPAWHALEQGSHGHSLNAILPASQWQWPRYPAPGYAPGGYAPGYAPAGYAPGYAN